MINTNISLKVDVDTLFTLYGLLDKHTINYTNWLDNVGKIKFGSTTENTLLHQLNTKITTQNIKCFKYRLSVTILKHQLTPPNKKISFSFDNNHWLSVLDLLSSDFVQNETKGNNYIKLILSDLTQQSLKKIMQKF